MRNHDGPTLKNWKWTFWRFAFLIHARKDTAQLSHPIYILRFSFEYHNPGGRCGCP